MIRRGGVTDVPRFLVAVGNKGLEIKCLVSIQHFTIYSTLHCVVIMVSAISQLRC